MATTPRVLDRTFALEYQPQIREIERCSDASEDRDLDGLAGCEDPDCFGRCEPLCPAGAFTGCTSPRCGDGTCDPRREDRHICPQDCT